MPSTTFLRNHGKTSRTPNRPFEKERMDAEMKLIGEYGLKNKREVWRVQLALAKIRKASRVLLTLDEKDPRRVFEGAAILRRLLRTGVLPEDRLTLDYVLALKAAVSPPRRTRAMRAQPWAAGALADSARRVGTAPSLGARTPRRTFLSAGCRRRCSSLASPKASTTRAC